MKIILVPWAILGLWTGLVALADASNDWVVNAEEPPPNHGEHRELYFLDFLDPPACSAYGGCFLGLFGATVYIGTGADCQETCAFFPFFMRLIGYTCGTCGGQGEKYISSKLVGCGPS